MHENVKDILLTLLIDAQNRGEDMIYLPLDFAWIILNKIHIQIEKPSRYISSESRYLILKRQKWKCNICGKRLKYSEKHEYGDEVAHIDHIYPFSQWKNYPGDINGLSNLQALCPDCNLRKSKNNIN